MRAHDHIQGRPQRLAERNPLGSEIGKSLQAHAVWRSLMRLARQRPDIIVLSLSINVLSLSLPIVILQIYDRVIPNAATATLTLLVIGLVGVIFFEATLKLARHFLINWWATRFGHALGSWGVARMLATDLPTFERDPAGTQLRRFSAIDVVRDFYSGQSLIALIDLPFACLFLALIAMIGGPLVFVPIATLGLAALAALYVGRRLGKAIAENQAADDRRYSFLIEVLRGFQTIKGLGMESLMVRRHERLQESSSAGAYNTSQLTGMTTSFGEMFGQFTIIGIAGVGSLIVLDGGMTMGSLAACILLGGRTMQPLVNAIGAWKQLQSAVLAQSTLRDVSEMTAEASGRREDLDDFRGGIELQNVSVSYEGSDEKVLDNVSIKIEPGEIVVVKGASGAGKSTLLLTLMGLVQPQEGRVLLDGINRAEFDPWAVREKMALLPTHGELFYGTILENLTKFEVQKNFDEAMELVGALGLHEVFAHLPDGLDSKIDDVGLNVVPSGVRQLIVIVRTLLNDPRVILFDEANTALDLAGDKRLGNLISQRMADVTSVLVTHRPSFERLADRAFELRDGRLCEVEKRAPAKAVDETAKSAPEQAA
jgi:ATP-binding cassette subfamily C protein LapB